MVDVRAIGAGGGSLAWVDAGGILKVGPRSAGADPGPACYGRGGTQADRHGRQRRARPPGPGVPAGGRPRAGRRGRAGGARRARGHARPLARPRGAGDRRRRERQHGPGAAPRLHRPRLRPARRHPRGLRRRRPAARLRARARPADAAGAGAALPRCLLRLRRAAGRHALRLHADPLDAHVAPRRGGRGRRLRRPGAAGRGRLPGRGLLRGAAARALDRHALRRAELGAERAHAGRRAHGATTSPRPPGCSSASTSASTATRSPARSWRC